MFKLKVNRNYEEKANGRKVTITDVRGDDSQFIGYRWDDEPEVRWCTADEFRADFIPLSKISLEERCHVLGSTVADIKRAIDTCEDCDHHFIDELKGIIEKCVQELRTDV